MNGNTSKSAFIAQSEICDEDKESFLENEFAYTRECVQFLDTLDFNDDDLSEDAFDYFDSTL